MARPQKGLWRNERNGEWYVTIKEAGKRRQVRLGTDRTQAEIKLGEQRKLEQATTAGDWSAFAAIADLFLGYIKAEHPKSYRMYRNVLKSFVDAYPSLRVKDITEKRVFEWLDSNPTWKGGTRRFSITVIVACLRWARKDRQGPLIKGEYLVGIKKPPSRSRGRKAVFSEKEFISLVSICPQWLADALNMLWNTGARPSEICNITAADCNFPNRMVILDAHKTADKTGQPRVLDMTDAVFSICKRLAAKTPEGPIFRSGWRRPLNPVSLHSSCQKYAKRAGVKIFPYAFRHSLATHLLEQGTDPQMVARILGHKSTDMLWTHYAHLLANRPAHRAAIAAVRPNLSDDSQSTPAVLPMHAG